MRSRQNSATLTSHHTDEEVELLHGVAEGGDDEPQPGQAATEHDDWTTAKLVDQDAADWTWKANGTTDQSAAQIYRRALG